MGSVLCFQANSHSILSECMDVGGATFTGGGDCQAEIIGWPGVGVGCLLSPGAGRQE